jgi:uncharacterized protein involved in response to NO
MNSVAPRTADLRTGAPTPPAARGRRQPAGPWRWRHLLWAPHRLAFLGALVVLLSSGLWWAAVQVDRLTGAFGLGYAVPPSVTHAAVMTLGFMPLFFAGFLFTAGPKWLGVAGPAAGAILPTVALQVAGWLIWLLGAHTQPGLALAGGLLALAGLALQNARFWSLVRASSVPDRLHANVVAVAGSVGVLCLSGMVLALWLDRPDLARVAVIGGLWGFVVPTYLAVAHRMIPFFTSSAVPMVRAWRPFWVLWFLLGTAGLELAAVGLEALGIQHPALLVALALAELVAGGVVLWLGVAWGLVQSLKIRLLAMLHLGFVWLGLALLLAGAARGIALVDGAPVLSLGALHALTMGFLGSTLLAMVTRVACGHSGRTLVADGLIWLLFWLLQLAVLLRIAGSLAIAPAWVLPVAALLWAGLMAVWGVRLGSWFGRPRVDGRPG